LVFGLSYLGPLREAPHRFYANDRKLHPNVGSKGQHSANIIRTFSAGERKRLDGWLNQFEFGKALVLEGLDADAFSLRLETFGGLKVNITDVGFGLSQTLPLIVQSIANDDQDLIIAEQPEIHLNPKLQGTLADLFTSTISQGTHYLVETHSEHLVLRLRSLIAEGKLSADDLGLYFVEKESGYSTLHTIPVDNTGAIQEWPKGFFQDGLSESLRLSRLQAKARKS
jgi:predicted ATPase